MDNICHTLIAGALAKTGIERATPRATAALVVAANLPDADIVATLFTGPGGYLVHHRGITHSFVGVLALGPLVALALLWYSRRRDPVGPNGGARFWPLLWVSWIGLASHLLLDWTNPYGVRPWLPFDNRWVYGDWIAIVDPWLWLVPGVALFWLTARDLLGRVAWGAAAAALSAAVLLSGQAGWMSALWLGGLAVGVAGGWLRVRRSGERVAWAALALVVAYWGAAGLAHRSVAASARAALAPSPSAELAAIPTPGDPSTWRVVEYARDSVTVGVWELGDDRGSLVLGRKPLGLDDPAARAALATDAGRAMRIFARFLFAETAQRPNGTVVYLRDARYALEERTGWGVMPIVVPAEALP